MASVLVDITTAHTPEAADVVDPDDAILPGDVVVIEDADGYTTEAMPGCGEANPYND